MLPGVEASVAYASKLAEAKKMFDDGNPDPVKLAQLAEEIHENIAIANKAWPNAPSMSEIYEANKHRFKKGQH